MNNELTFLEQDLMVAQIKLDNCLVAEGLHGGDLEKIRASIRTNEAFQEVATIQKRIQIHTIKLLNA